MKLLHTSDWHLGHTLQGRKRYPEHEAFLEWLVATIREQGVELLLVAGDLFDTTTPSNRAQELYYRFLHRLADSPCRHVVVIAGNHDSPSFLEAPAPLLRALDVHVVGIPREEPEGELVSLFDRQGRPELLVCAVPYLRDRDLRLVEPGEGVEEKERKLLEGIRRHYARVVEAALARRQALGGGIPVVAMGHLFAAGGRLREGDGVRELYVGSLGHVPAGIFPPGIDYLALGHLHAPQRVGGSEVMRYSGAPLPMGFGEADAGKSVLVVELLPGRVGVTPLPVPRFQNLARVEGDWEGIRGELARLAAAGESCWLEVVYRGEELAGDLGERLEREVAGTPLEILGVRNHRLLERLLERGESGETLENLSEEQVFQRCLEARGVAEGQRPGLWAAFREIVTDLPMRDLRAE